MPSHPELTEAETRDLRCLVGMMIPPSAEYAVPGADDPAIFASLLESLGRDRGDVHAALQEIATRVGGAFADGEPAARQAVFAAVQASPSPALAVLNRVVLLCYYRDERVIRSLGREVRAPFPRGYPLEQGDWSLLDTVRARPRLWRDAS